MDTFKKLIIIAVILVGVSWATPTYAAWLFEDSFNSDTKSTGDLNGQDGWDTCDTDFDVTATNPFEGDQTVTATAANGACTNTFTDSDNGKLYFSTRRAGTTSDGQIKIFSNNGVAIRIQFVHGDGNDQITIRDGAGSFTLVNGFTNDIYYTTELEYFTDCTHIVRIHDTKGWSAFSGTLDGRDCTPANDDLDAISLEVGGSGSQTNFDNITATNPLDVPIVYRSTVSNSSAGTNSLVISNAVNTGTNRVMVVSIGYKDAGGGEVTNVRFNAAGGDVEFVQLSTESKNGEANSQMWYLAGASSETADVTVVTTNSVRIGAAVSVFTNVDQTNPFRTAATASSNGTTGNSAPITVDVIANDEETVIDSAVHVSAGPDTVSSQTGKSRSEVTGAGGGTDVRAMSQTLDSSGATETMAYTMSSDDNWATIAGALQKPQPASTADQGVPLLMQFPG